MLKSPKFILIIRRTFSINNHHKIEKLEKSKVIPIWNIPTELRRAIERSEKKQEEGLNTLENNEYKKLVYNDVYPRNHRPFSWQIKSNSRSSPKSLPKRLYNIKKECLDIPSEDPSKENYAALSYVWGEGGV